MRLVPVVLMGCEADGTGDTGDTPTTTATAVAQADAGTATTDTSATTTAPDFDAEETADDAVVTSAAPAEPECGKLTAQEAVERWIDEVPPHVPQGGGGGDRWEWYPDRIDAATYDPCADLSWLLISIEDSKSTSPWALMLFHRGEYVGLATEDYTRHPEVERLSDASVEVTYRWTKEGETNVEASGRSVSVLTWDPDTDEVTQEGELPPGIGDGEGSAEGGSGDGAAGGAGIVPGAHPAAGTRAVPPGAVPMGTVEAYGRQVAVFRTASGGMGCEFEPGWAGCGVNNWIRNSPEGRPSVGGSSWWVDLGVQGEPSLIPRGDLPAFENPAAPILSPGEIVVHGDYVCASEQAGLTCWNIQTGHGAFMSETDFRPF